MFECEILNGLKPIVLDEIEEIMPNARLRENDDPARILLRAKGTAAYKAVAELRTIIAAHELTYYPIPRPKALLGHQHFRTLMQQIEKIVRQHPKNTFSTFTINAAGRDSSVFQRLREEIEKESKLQFQAEDADLHLRFRKSITQPDGWETLIRITPRPNVTRPWRVANMPGALNASIAAAMVRMSEPTPEDRYLNLMSGSGTLMIERLLHGPAVQCVGVEMKHNPLTAARENAEAAGLTDRIVYKQGDATQTQLDANSFDVIVSDPPWGQLVGEQERLDRLYEDLLNEIYRLATEDARILLLSHSMKKMMEVLERQAERWLLVDEVQVKQGGLHPRIYVLRKRG